MVSNYNVLLRRVTVNYILDVLYRLLMMDYGIQRSKSRIVALTVTNDSKVIYHTLNDLHSSRIILVHIRPEGAAYEGHTINLNMLFIKEVNVRIILHFFPQPIIGIREATMVELVVATTVDGVGELAIYSLEKLSVLIRSTLVPTRLHGISRNRLINGMIMQ
jgi:hypothetical protein